MSYRQAQLVAVRLLVSSREPFNNRSRKFVGGSLAHVLIGHRDPNSCPAGRSQDRVGELARVDSFHRRIMEQTGNMARGGAAVFDIYIPTNLRQAALHER